MTDVDVHGNVQTFGSPPHTPAPAAPVNLFISLKKRWVYVCHITHALGTQASARQARFRS